MTGARHSGILRISLRPSARSIAGLVGMAEGDMRGEGTPQSAMAGARNGCGRCGRWRIRATSCGNCWSQIRKIARFSVYGFFPAAYDLVYGDEAVDVDVRYDGRTRGRVAIITGRLREQTVDIVIKPCQSPAEAEIARIAGELNLGPRQLPSVQGFLTEEFVHGPFLTDLNPDEAAPERMHGIGYELGSALSGLHAAGVCYNDATVSDPDGRSHTILQPDGGIRLIDFGVALLLRDHPANLTFHDAYNAARTDPHVSPVPADGVERRFRRIRQVRTRLWKAVGPTIGRGDPVPGLAHRRRGDVDSRRQVRVPGRRRIAGWNFDREISQRVTIPGAVARAATNDKTAPGIAWLLHSRGTPGRRLGTRPRLRAVGLNT